MGIEREKESLFWFHLFTEHNYQCMLTFVFFLVFPCEMRAFEEKKYLHCLWDANCLNTPRYHDFIMEMLKTSVIPEKICNNSKQFGIIKKLCIFSTEGFVFFPVTHCCFRISLGMWLACGVSYLWSLQSLTKFRRKKIHIAHIK